MFRRWEKKFLRLIQNEQPGIFQRMLHSVLYFFSWIFALIVKIRNWFFSRKIPFLAGKPIVISIGNIVAGGTGKTPTTLMLAQAFYPQHRVAILSRGYRSHAEHLEEPTVLSRGGGSLHSALYCGDEPCLLIENLPKALAFVGKNRVKAAKMATDAGAELILVDDGMQHHKLSRHYEVVVMDGKEPLGKGHYLPRGLLRDDPKSLKRADLIILNHTESQEHYDLTKKALASYTSAPIVATKLEVIRVVGFEGREIESIEGLPVSIFCSVAKPDYFEETVKGLGANVIDRYVIADHEQFDLPALQQFAKESLRNGAKVLICTEKDKVKLIGNLSGSIRVAWVQVRLKITHGEENWQSFIKEIEGQLLTA